MSQMQAENGKTSSVRLERVFQVLRMVAASRTPTRMKTIREELGLDRSTVSRIVAELISCGMISKCDYHSVIPTPELAVMGRRAGENHPLARIAEAVLPPQLESMQLAGDLAVLAFNGLHHFFMSPDFFPAAPFWSSDLTAVILASGKKTPETLKAILPPGREKEFSLLMERTADAVRSGYLADSHGGRFWQITVPVQCGPMTCALSLAAFNTSMAPERILYEANRLAAKLRSVYENWKPFYADR